MVESCRCPEGYTGLSCQRCAQGYLRVSDSSGGLDLALTVYILCSTDLGGAPMVESCRCPEGYTGLSCQRCAQGYLRVSDGSGGLGRCVRCNCNGHATACDPDSGRCLVSFISIN